VLSIFDAHQREILYLGAYQEHLLLRERLRAQDWHLDRPELVVFEALATRSVGDTLRVAARRAGSARCLSVNDEEVCGLAFTPGRLWSLLLYPSVAPPRVQRMADLAFMLALFVPLGLGANSLRRAGINAAIAAAVMTMAIASTRLHPDPLIEPIGALAGVALGYAAGAALRRSRSGASEENGAPTDTSPLTSPSPRASPGWVRT
jgi:hypothetical protein